MLRVEALESVQGEVSPGPAEEFVRRWGEYLDYLNAFYLLLDSAMVETANFGLFQLHEITIRDAFRVRYEDGKYIGESLITENISSVFQMRKIASSNPDGVPNEHDRHMIRHVVPRTAIEHASNNFSVVIDSPEAVKDLAALTKSLGEYKVGNYATSLVLAWFIIERGISSMWEHHLDSLNRQYENDQKRINSERRKFLTGSNFSASIVSNFLELSNVLPYELFDDIDTVRGFRNDVVHKSNYKARAADAQLALKTAQKMIRRIRDVDFSLNLNYSVSGL